MKMIRTLSLSAIYGSLALALLACSAKEVTHKTSGNSMTGIVKYGNDQVMFGLVIVNAGLQQSQGSIREDGTYLIENVPIGEVLIAVNTDAGKGEYMSKTMGQAYTGPQGKGKGKVDVKFIDVPKKYADKATSGLKYTVVAGENNHNIIIPK